MDQNNYTTEHRKGQHLTSEERHLIEVRYNTDHWTIYRIAKELGRAYNTVKNEINRGTVLLYNGKVKRYKADVGHAVYLEHRQECRRKLRCIEVSMFLQYVVMHKRKVCSSDNWTYTSLDCLGGRKGLTDEFNYQTVCLHILSGILYQATNMKTVDYANKYLFEPLGIAEHKNYYAETAEEHKAFTIGKIPKENIWFSDPDGLGTPGYGLCMSAEDMAKIGLICLNKGNYNGRQIISSEWITEMICPRTVESDQFRGMEYGYLWWIIDRQKNIYAAIGNSGNVIYVNSEKNIVVAVASYFKPTVFDRVDFIQEYIEPLFTE